MNALNMAREETASNLLGDDSDIKSSNLELFFVFL